MECRAPKEEIEEPEACSRQLLDIVASVVSNPRTRSNHCRRMAGRVKTQIEHACCWVGGLAERSSHGRSFIHFTFAWINLLQPSDLRESEMLWLPVTRRKQLYNERLMCMYGRYDQGMTRGMVIVCVHM